MNGETKARLIAAIAAPLFLLHAQPARCGPIAETAPATLPHLSISA